MQPRLRIAATAVAVLALAACSGGEDEDAEALDEPTDATATETTPEPEPEPEPVVGELDVRRNDVSSAVGLGLPAPDPAADAAVDGFADDVAGLLDGHLAAATDDTVSPLLDAALDGLLAEPAAEATLAALADPDDHPAAATYDVTVNVAGEPEWATVVVSTTSEAGTTAGATLLFALDDAAPVLVGVGEVDA